MRNMSNTCSIILATCLIVLGIPLTGVWLIFNIDFIGIFLAIVSFLLCFVPAGFLIHNTVSRIKKDKFIKENTKEIEKNIYKGLVICKDKTSNTSSSGNSNLVYTSHTYKTTIRTIGVNSFNLYFKDEHTFVNCFEQEEVAVAEFLYKDEKGNVINSEYKFLGTYKYYEEFIQNQSSNSIVPIDYVQSFTFKDENIINPYCKQLNN
ncbi:MAG: hypothetical protein E6649_16005 [Paeniclostridium sordellii]|nr:hypothetical protein [Paeniclostridium sordellii]